MQLFSAEESTWFADVILPVPIPRTFTYRLSRELEGFAQPGSRVVVQFGKTKVLTGIVAALHHSPPEKYQAKYILEVLDDSPIVSRHQLELFQWIAEYYVCCIGEVMNVALPSGLKITSQSKIQYNPDFDYDHLLTTRERTILEEIQKQGSITYDELARIADVKSAYHIIKTLVEKRAILVFEEVKEKYMPKIVRFVRLNSFYEDADNLKALIAALDKPKEQKQLAVLMQYISQVAVLRNVATNQQGLEKGAFAKNEISTSALDTLLKKGVFESFDRVISRFTDITTNEISSALPSLSDSQERAYNEILCSFQSQNTVLLHGITGSGKTEVYIHLIQQALESGSQVLYLLPEIALTTQIVVRLQRIFGEKIGIYHSKFSDNERVEVWKGIISGKFQFIVGVRSAVFLPFDSLGLIIIDEEHEASYKQYDPAPRYHARDVALVIAQKQRAKVLLGSATPSMESYHHASTQKYGMVKLSERFGNAQLPDIQLIDLKLARQQKRMTQGFSDILIKALQQNLAQQQQSILFQNRRGYSPLLQCEDCSWTGKCHQCDVSLVHHLNTSELRCHYCGYKENAPRLCPACGSTKLKNIGYGTEKIEDEIKEIFLNARVSRMDLDTTRSKTAFQQLVTAVEEGQTDILVGTQMIAKGLDFDKVSVVGIFDADRLIHFPDFRASERAFQLLTQVSGRAGRRATQGKVFIQTNNPTHHILQRIVENDYEGLYMEEIQEREAYNYPPFTRLIRLTIRNVDADICRKAAHFFAEKLAEQLGKSRVLGPETPVVNKIRNRYLMDILIKLERTLNHKAVKIFMRETTDYILTDRKLKDTDVIIDVDCV